MSRISHCRASLLKSHTFQVVSMCSKQHNQSRKSLRDRALAGLDLRSYLREKALQWPDVVDRSLQESDIGHRGACFAISTFTDPASVSLTTFASELHTALSKFCQYQLATPQSHNAIERRLNRLHGFTMQLRQSHNGLHAAECSLLRPYMYPISFCSKHLPAVHHLFTFARRQSSVTPSVQQIDPYRIMKHQRTFAANERYDPQKTVPINERCGIRRAKRIDGRCHATSSHQTGQESSGWNGGWKTLFAVSLLLPLAIFLAIATGPGCDDFFLPVLRKVAPTVSTPVPILLEEIHSAWNATQERLRRYDNLMQSAATISGGSVPTCEKTTKVLTGLADGLYSAVLEHDPLNAKKYADLKWPDSPSQCAKRNTWMQWPPLFIHQQPAFDSLMREINEERSIPIQVHLALLKARLNKFFITNRIKSAVFKASRELTKHVAQAEATMVVTKVRLTQHTAALMYTPSNTKQADALSAEIRTFETEGLPKLAADLNRLLRSTNDLAWKLTQV